MKACLCLLLMVLTARAAHELAGPHWRARIDDSGRLVSYELAGNEMLAPFTETGAPMIIRVDDKQLAFAGLSTGGKELIFESDALQLRYSAAPAGLNIAWQSRTMARIDLRWRFSAAAIGSYDSEDDTFVDPHDTWYNDMVDPRIRTTGASVLTIRQHGYWTREPYRAEGVGCYGTTVYPRNAGECTWIAEPTPSTATALVFEVRGENPDFLPPGGGPATFPCAAENIGSTPLAFSWTARVVRFPSREEVLVTQGKVTLKGLAKDVVPVNFVLTEPGVYQGRLELQTGDTVCREKVWNFCYDFANYHPVAPKPEDFDAFWQQTLVELANIPVDLKRTEIERNDQGVLYKLNYAVLNGERASAWLRVPAGAGPFPVRLELPPSGVNALPPPAAGSGAVEMKIAIHGYDVDKSDFPPAPYPWPGARYHNFGMADKNTYFYRNVYARCWRAVDMLLAMPEVDKDRIMVFGGSQGGGLSVIAAAYRPEVGMCAPGFPGLCRLDWTVRDEVGSWPLSKADIPEGQDLATMLHTLSYFDVANFIGRVKCPIVATIGWMDNITGAPGQVAAFAQAPRDKFTIFCAPWGRHGASARTQQLFYRAHREFLQGQPLSLPQTWTVPKPE